jgi:hypothetical protein
MLVFELRSCCQRENGRRGLLHGLHGRCEEYLRSLLEAKYLAPRCRDDDLDGRCYDCEDHDLSDKRRNDYRKGHLYNRESHLNDLCSAQTHGNCRLNLHSERYQREESLGPVS